MRTRRSFQPTLYGMPARIAPSAGMLHTVVASVSTVANGATLTSHASGVSVQARASSHGSSGIQVNDSTDPSDTPTGDGTTQVIIQPVTVATTQVC